MMIMTNNNSYSTYYREMRFAALYFHIPFCLSKCNYCDFISFPVGKESADPAAYIPLLRRELALWREEIAGAGTAYFGGGTPTLLPPGELAAFVLDLRKSCPELEEITIEANPGTITGAGLNLLRQAGVNRLSLGIQSFDDEFLAAMGRAHTKREARQVFHEARRADFGNISLDLIYGLPGQSLANWRQQLETALELAPEHISLYGLALSPASPWGRALAKGELVLPNEDLAADMMELGGDILTAAGFEHYEIANFARPGRRSRHNQVYWRRENYLGLGLAAASCRGSGRWHNLSNLKDYTAALEANKKPLAGQEHLTREQELAETIILGLRLKEGVNLAVLSGRFRLDVMEKYTDQTKDLIAWGLVELAEGHLRLTKRGLPLANEVFYRFLPD